MDTKHLKSKTDGISFFSSYRLQRIHVLIIKNEGRLPITALIISTTFETNLSDVVAFVGMIEVFESSVTDWVLVLADVTVVFKLVGDDSRS